MAVMEPIASSEAEWRLAGQTWEMVRQRIARLRAMADEMEAGLLEFEAARDDAGAPSICAEDVPTWQPGARGFNPPYEECECDLAINSRGGKYAKDGRRYHGWLLDLESDTFGSLVQILADLQDTLRWQLCRGDSDFETFFAQHHWCDQVHAASLGRLLDSVARSQWEAFRDQGFRPLYEELGETTERSEVTART